MTRDEKQELIEKVIAEAKKLTEPVDFAGLEKKEILIKAGAWYRVPDFRKLPENVLNKIYAVASDSKGAKVKLYKTTALDKLARKFKKYF